MKQDKDNRFLPREHTGHRKHSLPKCKRRLYSWTSPDGQYQNQIDYIFCSQRWRSSIQYAKTRLGADCGSDPELLIAKFRLKLKKVGETTRPFRYDLNQIPDNYTVEVTNRFKGLDMIDRGPMDRGSWHCTVGRDQDHSEVKEMQRGKILVWEDLTNSCEWKESKGKWEKERYTHLNAEFQRIERGDKKAFLSDQSKETEETKEWERLEISSRKLDT